MGGCECVSLCVCVCVCVCVCGGISGGEGGPHTPMLYAAAAAVVGAVALAAAIDSSRARCMQHGMQPCRASRHAPCASGRLVANP